MTLNRRGRSVKQKKPMSSKGKSNSGRTREMVLIPWENFVEMVEKLKTLSESK